ncbi:MAG: RNA polymerase sigma factor [Luteolibacter sp.]|jgi:RNA polymerase sigma-70 factor (ECF subfamily)|nr:RNA polymerase sigma factor [Luteolibacter sp.]
MDAPDSELMARLAAGDDLALNALMTRWSARVSAFLFRMTGQREVAVDIAQETFVKLYQARGGYKPRGNFSTYLFAIAANLARNHVRWKKRHPTVSLDATDSDGSEIYGEPADPNQSPGEAVIAREKSAAVHRAVLALPPDLREALSLFIYEDLGYTEIAELSRCSAKAVETRIYRARQILKEQLKELR